MLTLRLTVMKILFLVYIIIVSTLGVHTDTVLRETSYQLKIFVSQNPGTQLQYPDVWSAFTLGNHRQ